MTAAFADSFYFIAVLNPADQYHLAAMNLTRMLTRPVITSRWVLIEVGDALSYPAIRSQTFDFLQSIVHQPGITVIDEQEPWYSRGLELYGNRRDKDWSLTDCISFEIMREHEIVDALTGDHHFIQAGFRALLADGQS
jgi:uncharacterized protein